MKKIISSLLMLVGISLASTAQMLTLTDPGMAYSKLLLEKGANSYSRVGNFKVQGSPYLYGEQVTADVYSPGQTGKDVQIKIETYAKQVEIGTAQADKFMIKSYKEVDSLVLKTAAGTLFSQNLVFVNSGFFDPNTNLLLQVVFRGPTYTLYKAYTSNLGIVSTNIIQSDLRQFDLSVDYYYTHVGETGLKKLKLTKPGVRKEFKNSLAMKNYDDDSFNTNPEKVLVLLFTALNNSN